MNANYLTNTYRNIKRKNMVKKTITFMCLLYSCVFIFYACGEKSISTVQLAEKSLEKGISTIDLGLYPGTFLMHAMSELALISPDPGLLPGTIELFEKYKTGEIKGRGSYISYEAGGTGAPLLVYKNKADVLSEQVLDAAVRMMSDQKRSSEGLLVPPWAKEEADQVFIDMAFAVTPYLLYTGLHCQRPDYVDLAVYETTELFRILKDENSQLLNQARGFMGKNSISEDNWSRGNGWGAFALALLVRDLPGTHPKKEEVDRLAKEFFTAIVRYQDRDGMWHQEMTDHDSYVETSGTGLLLFGIGIMLEEGILDSSYYANFIKGLRGYTSYITEDGSVSNTTIGCLSPRTGSKDDYRNRPWAFNDHHAFGPVVLAYTQAYKMGIKDIKPLKRLGCYAIPDTVFSETPKAYVRYVPQRKDDIAWENDRIAFRVFGPPVKDQVGSGIDVWAKSVRHPIIDKWYYLNGKGEDYHTDRGEGCDFYDMGYFRGCGGAAVWKDGKPHAPQTYFNHRILKNDGEEIVFELTYSPFDVDNIKVSERKTVSMKKGTNLFRVSSVFETGSTDDLVIGIGLTTFGNPTMHTDKENGLLSCWEQIDPQQGHLGTAILVNPDNVHDFTEYQKDQFVLVRARPGIPVVYYSGAGWSKSPDFENEGDWLKYLEKEVKRSSF